MPTDPTYSMGLALQFKENITYKFTFVANSFFIKKSYMQTHIRTRHTHLILTVKNTLWVAFLTKSIVLTRKEFTWKDTGLLAVESSLYRSAYKRPMLSMSTPTWLLFLTVATTPFETPASSITEWHTLSLHHRVSFKSNS
jgi:hypothetical protein